MPTVNIGWYSQHAVRRAMALLVCEMDDGTAMVHHIRNRIHCTLYDALKPYEADGIETSMLPQHVWLEIVRFAHELSSYKAFGPFGSIRASSDLTRIQHYSHIVYIVAYGYVRPHSIRF